MLCLICAFGLTKAMFEFQVNAILAVGALTVTAADPADFTAVKTALNLIENKINSMISPTIAALSC